MVLARLCEALGSPANGCEHASEADKLDIQDVAKAAGTRDVSFVLTTVPDYVDSNTAWMADEILGAVQAALPHHGYVIERFYLPEVPQST